MMARAVKACESHKTVIVVLPFLHTERYARSLVPEIPENLRFALPRDESLRGLSLASVQVFVDHSVWETTYSEDRRPLEDWLRVVRATAQQAGRE